MIASDREPRYPPQIRSAAKGDGKSLPEAMAPATGLDTVHNARRRNGRQTYYADNHRRRRKGGLIMDFLALCVSFGTGTASRVSAVLRLGDQAT